MGTLREDVFTFRIISHWIILRMRNILDKSCKGNQNKHFMFRNFFFRESCRLWDNIEKYGGASRATNDFTVWCIWVAWWISKATCTNMRAHAHTSERTRARARAHTQICRTYCFSTATIGTWKRLDVTLYVHGLSCLFYESVFQNYHIYLNIRQLFCNSFSGKWWGCHIIQHRDKNVLFRYFPKNRRLWRRIILYSGTCIIQGKIIQ